MMLLQDPETTIQDLMGSGKVASTNKIESLLISIDDELLIVGLRFRTKILIFFKKLPQIYIMRRLFLPCSLA
jgi:hypothetical protein